ncbi:LON peptidase substrate-binding domain-containing protein [Aeromicrobium sp.]|uniref:LON peptidase substrate-binding domain-containing protein n=1 Tax=Aeromicrobium sp. TaxID=1871063 RepID=UPI0030C082EB
MDGERTGDVVEMPMFPLGSVLFPAMPLPLRVFEPRYLTMLQDLLPSKPMEFGVVLIERGQEVGGGEKCFSTGTVARIGEVRAGDDFVGILSTGTDRIEVVEWLEESPYPRARVRLIPDLEWDETCEDRRVQTELLVRRTLARASEFEEQLWPPTIELMDDPVGSLWQLAGIAPVGPLDQVRLLRSGSAREILDATFVAVTDAAEALDARST